MKLSELTAIMSITQQRKLSGGITCSHLRVIESGQRELTITGDVTITIKVIDLTTKGAPKLGSLMASTQHLIGSKLKGITIERGRFLAKYDVVKQRFNPNIPEIYDFKYRINYIVKLEQIKMLSQLFGNDFVLAVVDDIGYATDKLHSGGLTRRNGPATVAYKYWNGYPNIGAHEFFHTLGLDDLKNRDQNKRLMYERGDIGGTEISNQELANMNNYLMTDLINMSNSNYSNPSFDTKNKLRTLLNDTKNAYKYNKAKFR